MNAMMTEKMNVPPLTSVSDSLILMAWTKENANKYIAMIKERISAAFTSMK